MGDGVVGDKELTGGRRRRAGYFMDSIIYKAGLEKLRMGQQGNCGGADGLVVGKMSAKLVVTDPRSIGRIDGNSVHGRWKRRAGFLWIALSINRARDWRCGRRVGLGWGRVGGRR